MRTAYFLFMVFIGLLAGSAAFAQANCAATEIVRARLQSNYGESPQGAGLQSASSIFEIWANLEKGTWTILMTKSDGSSCIMASGTNWQDNRNTPLPEGDPA